MNWAGLPIFIALEPVDMRMGYDRLSGCVAEHMKMQPRSKALFVFVGKRGNALKILTSDSTGVIIVSKRLDGGRFDLPVATSHGQSHVVLSDVLLAAIFKGIAVKRKKRKRLIH